jgi:hypothetical protein
MEVVTVKGLKENLDTLQTGDILLFAGSDFWFSKVVRWWTKSQFSHVGMVLRDPTYISPELTGLYMWESGIESFADSEDHVKKLGVQITSLDELFETNPDYKLIVYRKLNTSIPKETIERKIKDIHEVVHNRPYDINLYDFLMASANVKYVETPREPSKWFFINWLRPDHRRNDTYFCSALVGFIYTELGLLPSTTKWTECFPDFFSSEDNPTMKITSGNYLDVDKLLYQKPK